MTAGRVPSCRELAAFAALAAGVRALVAGATLMPSRDGATYLWMAERVAAGDLGAAFRTVFHPLYPLLAGGLLALFPALPPMAGGQLAAGVCGALAVVPLQAMAAACFGPGAGRVAAVLYAFGVWFARYPAECASEGCFYAAVALWAWALLGAGVRPGLAGAAAAAAYAVRPEGLALVAFGWLRLRLVAGAGTARFLWGALPLGAAVPIGYALWGGGLTLTPKAAFNYDVGIGGADSPLGHYLHHALRVPGTAFEAIGYLALPLAVLGFVQCWRDRASRWSGPALWLVAPFVLQVAVVPLLRSHARFLSGFGMLLLPLAGAALAPWLARRAPVWGAVALGAVLLPDLARLPVRRGGEREIERELGEWLRPRLRPGDFIATEMPRLEYFAGLQPGPPRAPSREALLRSAASPRARFTVVVAPRSHITAADLEGIGLHAVSLPEAISTLARQRQLLVYGRE